MTDRPHPVAEKRLGELREQLMRMGRLVEAILEKSLRAVEVSDQALADQVKTDDLAIDRLDISIDQAVLEFLALQSPVAHDLRQAIAIKTAAVDLERVGDQARNVADCARRLSATAPVVLPQRLSTLAGECQRMLRSSLTAFADDDPELARAVLAADDQIDEDEDLLIREAISMIKNDPAITGQAVQIILIAKSLERVGDHATNIAEDVVMMAQALNLKHAEKIAQ
jgi:phosphate transport system protein